MVSLKHKFHSPKADGPDTTVARPTDWNDEHDFNTPTQGIVLGRDTSGSGAIQELPLAIDPDGSLHLVGGALELPAGPSSERPAPPAPGMIRYNEDLGALEAYVGGQWAAVATGGGVVPVGGTVGWYSNQVPTGWLFVNGETLGDAASASDHANDLYQALFTFLWNNIASCKASLLPGGPGATAAADWAAHKKMTLPDECGRTSYGANNMGGIVTKDRLNITRNSAGIDGETLGASGGEERHTLNVAELAPHSHPGPSFTGVGGFGGPALIVQNYSDGPPGGVTGSGTPHNTVAPGIIKNVIIKY